MWCQCPASSRPALPCFLLLHLPMYEAQLLDSPVWDAAALWGHRARETQVLPGPRATRLDPALVGMWHLPHQRCSHVPAPITQPGRAKVLHLWVSQLWSLISPVLTLVFATKLQSPVLGRNAYVTPRDWRTSNTTVLFYRLFSVFPSSSLPFLFFWWPVAGFYLFIRSRL